MKAPDEPNYVGATSGSSAASEFNPGTRVMTPEPDLIQLGCKLGKFILDELPYGDKLAFPRDIGTAETNKIVTILPGYHAEEVGTLPDGTRLGKEIEKSGLYAGNTAAHPHQPGYPVPSNGQIADYDLLHDGALRQWEFKGASHQVTKAMRIWYTYQVPGITNPDGTPVVRGTWLLVGFVGNGH